MNEPTTPLQRLNRTFIGSVLFIDIVGYSTRTVPDQLELKQVFNGLIADAMRNVVPGERIMVDTGDGAGIAFLGDPEEALFAALSLKDAIDSGKIRIGEPGFVRMGINLGPLKLVRDINGHSNMIGDGVNDAQRVMSFAAPGQVIASRSYYDIISRFWHDYEKLFSYEGTRHDKHVREHEVYRFGPVGDNEELTQQLRERSRARQLDAEQAATAARKWKAPWMPNKAAADKAAASSRSGLIATLVGAASVVGAVWSWSGTPEPRPEPVAGMAAPSVAPTPTRAASAPALATAVKSEKPSAGALLPAASEAATTLVRPVQVALAAPKASLTVEKKTAAGKAASAKEKAASAKSSAESHASAAKPGTVKLAIQPWGEIFVDGGKRGFSPPMKSFSLPPGKHKIEVRNGQFAPYKQTVEVKSGEEATVHYVF